MSVMIPNGLTPWQYLNKSMHPERFRAYLHENDISSAYNYLSNIYAVMLEADQTLHSDDIAGLYKQHISILREELGILEDLETNYRQLVLGDVKSSGQYISKEYIEHTKNRMLQTSIACLQSSNRVRFERTYKGREINTRGDFLPNLRENDPDCKTPYQMFLPYLVFWAKVIRACYPEKQLEQKLPITIVNAVHFMEAYSSDTDDMSPLKIVSCKNKNKKKRSVASTILFLGCSIITGIAGVYIACQGLGSMPAELRNPSQIITPNTYSGTTQKGKTYVDAGTSIKKNLTLTDDRQPNMTDLSKSASGEPIVREYNWDSFTGRSRVTMRMSVDSGIYLYYRNLPRQYSNDCKNYISDEFTVQFLQSINNSIDQCCVNQNTSSEWAKVKETIAFVQSIPYKTDSESTGKDEWPKYPYETIFDQCGDCEDKAFLLAGLLRIRGYDVVLLEFPEHMALGVLAESILGRYYEYNGKHYYYVETTTPGWNIGQIPDKYKTSMLTDIIPIN